MPYIDSDYYENTFKGTMPSDGNELIRLILRASDVIDMLIGYKLQDVDIDSADYNSFISQQIKKATAAQVQFFVLDDVDSKFSGESGAQSVGIGSFNYSSKDANITKEQGLVNPATLLYLSPTGLLHSGIDYYQGYQL